MQPARGLSRARVCAPSAACRKSGINQSHANDRCLPPPDADGSGAFRVSDQLHRGGAHHLLRGVLVRSGAEDLRPWCSCLCRPWRRHWLGLALLRGHRRCCRRGLGGDFVRAAGSGQSSFVEPSCFATGSGSRCPHVSGFVQRPTTSPTLFRQIMLQGARMPEILGARLAPYRRRLGLRSLMGGGPQMGRASTNRIRVIPALATECSGSEGKGVLERTERQDGRKWLQVCPRLCERCSRTGKFAKPRAGGEDG
jgi:hypothetical protein